MKLRQELDLRDPAQRRPEPEVTIEAQLSDRLDALDDSESKEGVLFSKVQQALQESEERLRQERHRSQQYLDTAEVILLALDLDGRITMVNRYACSVLGWTAEELLGADWIGTCLPARIRRSITEVRLNVLDGNRSSVQNPVLTRSGEERLIEWRNTVIRDDAGRIIGTLSSGADITEGHNAVEDLRVSEERMRFALQSANVGIWDMDQLTGALRWSNILEAQYGLQPATFSGTFEAFTELLHPADREAVLETIRNAMKLGIDFSVLHRTIWPDGTVRWLNGTGRVFLNERGEPVRAIGISQDVTERKLANDEIRMQRLRVFKATMRTVQDIVNNLLNGLQLVQLEPQGHSPAELQPLVDEMIQKAVVKLTTLGNLETVTEKETNVGLGIDYPGSAL